MLMSVSSCISTKWYKTLENKSALNDDLARLNGIYSNMPESYSDTVDFNRNPYDLYQLLFKSDKGYEYDEPRNYSGNIKIEAVSDRKIKASYIIGDTIIKEKIISGKLKHDVFSVKRKVFALFLIVFNFYKESKSSIYLDANGDLVVYNAIDAYGQILFASGGGENSHSGKFHRIQ